MYVCLQIQSSVYICACRDRTRMSRRKPKDASDLWFFFLMGFSLLPHRRVLNPKFLSLFGGWCSHFSWNDCLPIAKHKQPSILLTKHRSSIPHIIWSCHELPKTEGARREEMTFALLTVWSLEAAQTWYIESTHQGSAGWWHPLGPFPAQNTRTQHHLLLLEVMTTETLVEKPELSSTSWTLGQRIKKKKKKSSFLKLWIQKYHWNTLVT